MHRRLAVLAAAVALLPGPARAEEAASPLGLTAVDTADLRLVFPSPTLDYLEPHALRTFANSIAWQRRVFGWVPSERTTVLLKDFSDWGNASASATPVNGLTFDIAPLSLAFETYPASERLYSLMNHELVHVATMDVSSAGDRFWRAALLGKIYPSAQHPESLLWSYLTVPRFNVPRWYLEGSATFMETWMGGGLGRAQGGYDEMVFRAMVRDGARFYDPLGLVSLGTRVDFQVGVNAYLYGTRFFTWLALAHGPEKVVAWLRRDPGSSAYYAAQFEHVFGLTLDRAWQDWIAFEKDFQTRNLAEVRKHPVTPFQELVPRAVGSVSRAHFDAASGTLYGAFRYPGVVEHVGALDVKTGRIRRLADVKGAMLYKVTSLAWDPKGETLFYTSDNYALRDVRALDVRTGEERLLLEDQRIGELAFDGAGQALWGVRHASGLATLVRIPAPYREWSQVLTFPYGVVPYDLDVSPDGKLLSASTSEVNGDQYLRVWELAKLQAGDAKPLSEFRFGQSVPEGFVFSPDGRWLYGTSYYTGVSNVFRYEVATGKVDAVTNAESGFFRPVPLPDGRLVVFHYTGEGFVPAMLEAPRPLEDVSAIRFLGAELAARRPLVTTWQVPPPSKADPAAIAPLRRAPYVPLRELSVHGGYPVMEGYKDSIAAGWHLELEDALRFGALGLTAAYSVDAAVPERERPHAALDWRYLGWHAGVSWNRSDFYDLFGPTKRSRKGLATKLGWDRALVHDLPRRLDLALEAAFYEGLDALPGYQNVRSPVTRLGTASATLRYAMLRRSLGAVDDEKGVSWELGVDGSWAYRTVVPQGHGALSLGLPLFAHASVWSRTSAGLSGGERADPLAGFYFGGWKNNWVDSRAPQRYRDLDTLPGFAIDAFGAQSFAREQVELKLPPIMFERAGTPAFYLNWLRPSLFATGLLLDPADLPPGPLSRSLRGDAGAQVDLRFMVMHWYEMTLSGGWAVGFEPMGRRTDAWMLSLKIL